MPPGASGVDDLVGLNFPYVGPSETVRAKLRPHVRLVIGEGIQGLLGGLVLVAFTVVLPVYVELELRGSTALVVFVLLPAATILVERTGRALIDVYFTEYVVTDHRVYATTAFFKRTVKVVPFEKVTNLELRRGLFERLLGVGEVVVVAYGQKGTELRLRGLLDPTPVLHSLAHEVRSHSSIEHLLASD